jgi:metal-responsive CopG/Arc/MetJ family transcriptional regulator
VSSDLKWASVTTKALSNTVYTRPVAKVMISIPDDLLERLDALARARQETRSGFLQRLAERELQSDTEGRRKEVERLLDLATAPMGGDAAKLIREDRESH